MRLTGNVTGMGEMRKHTKFWSETLKGKYIFGNQTVSGRIILKLTLKMGCENVDWINLAQYISMWPALMNPTMISRYY
jgi:hypothetical protein